jgi:polyisoprenyl-phosphate glycosyltransferase
MSSTFMPGTDRAPDLTVVVPVYRNAASLAELAARLDLALAGRSYELLFVDDASPDDAGAVLRGLAGEDPRVCGIALAANIGQNRAVLAGLAHARGDAVAVMDGDLQDPPEVLPVLLSKLDQDGADAVFGTRRGRYETRWRLATGRVVKLVLWAMTFGRLPPNAGLFLVMRRAVAEQMVAVAGSDPYVLVLVARAANAVATVPAQRARTGVSSYTGAMRRRVARRALASAFRRDTGTHSYEVAERIGRRFAGEHAA